MRRNFPTIFPRPREIVHLEKSENVEVKVIIFKGWRQRYLWTFSLVMTLSISQLCVDFSCMQRNVFESWERERSTGKKWGWSEQKTLFLNGMKTIVKQGLFLAKIFCSTVTLPFQFSPFGFFFSFLPRNETMVNVSESNLGPLRNVTKIALRVFKPTCLFPHDFLSGPPRIYAKKTLLWNDSGEFFCFQNL